jgi:hypothetical protein
MSDELFAVRLQWLVHETAELIPDDPDPRYLLPSSPRPRSAMKTSRLLIAAATVLSVGGLVTVWALRPQPSGLTAQAPLSCPTITRWPDRPTQSAPSSDPAPPLVDFTPTSGLVCAYEPIGGETVASEWQRFIPTEQLTPIASDFNSLPTTIAPRHFLPCAAIPVTHFVVILRADREVTITYSGPCGYATDGKTVRIDDSEFLYSSLMALTQIRSTPSS